VVVDRGYLRVQHQWRVALAEVLRCPLFQVETDVVVPVAVASDHEEIGARTLRPKIHRQLAQFMQPLAAEAARKSSLGLFLGGLSPDNIDAAMASLNLDRKVAAVTTFHGGLAAARKRLASFIQKQLPAYAERRNDPGQPICSNLSPYLHFGQISPVEIALQVQNATGVPAAAKEAYLEELIVRRELAANFVFYNPDYDRFSSLPTWAQETLSQHVGDQRESIYSLAELEAAETSDPYWNAAQTEMVTVGKMHGYMRMYWGKRLLEWTETPEEAFRYALYLNNKYELDGRDPNAFTGVAWCFGKHDHPWQEREIFGKVRCMKPSGLERKFKIAEYVRRVRTP
jgi:deoxyribodipyrimidine photo-lyase